MPTWGLSAAARDTEPYGLKAWCLEPAKVITDPIHGDIFITHLERLILDTPPLQRLRRVRQLGTTHLVYPGAVHTRFAHSLGAVRVVQTLLDAALDQSDGNHPEPDLFAEWESSSKLEADELAQEAAEDDSDGERVEEEWRALFRRKRAEVVVAARLGALLHDIGHVPFGHTIEDDLRLLVAHDQNRSRLERLWTEVLNSCNAQIRESAERNSENQTDPEELIRDLQPLHSDAPLYRDLERLILSSEKDEQGKRIDPVDRIRYPFVADMVGNTICADLLDYLQRDHVSTGLPVSLGKRYLSSFYVTPELAGGIYPGRMALLIHRNGRERRDIVTEILKHLRYRYELQERVLVHHTKLAADAMVGKMFELWINAKIADLRANPKLLDRATGKITSQDPSFDYPREDQSEDRAEFVARWDLEQLLLRYGDDGVLEHLAAGSGTRAATAAAELARDLLNRRLYKPAANAVGAAAAEDLHRKFGSTKARRELEDLACEHAEIAEKWHLVIWIPDPDMRLKLAELLVNDGQGVAKFKDKSPLGSDIYADHKALWKISVFVHPTVTTKQTRSALAKLGEKLGISWDAYSRDLGPDPSEAPEHLAAARALGKPGRDDQVNELIAHLRSPEFAARGGDAGTQTELDLEAKTFAELHGWVPVVSDEDQTESTTTS